LKYSSEVFVSDKMDNRPPLLLLLGNPASHSVDAGMCFAFERGGQEHRFWRNLKEAGILTFLEQPPLNADPIEKNTVRRNALRELDYLSPFRLGIAAFYSLPSTSSDPKWSGVMGIRKLLGARAFGIISIHEEIRIDKLISRFIGITGGIIAFQKDAYNGVRSYDTQKYSTDLAFQGLLQGKYKRGLNIFLVGAPPTRMANTTFGKKAMLKYRLWLSQELNSYQ